MLDALMRIAVFNYLKMYSNTFCQSSAREQYFNAAVIVDRAHNSVVGGVALSCSGNQRFYILPVIVDRR